MSSMPDNPGRVSRRTTALACGFIALALSYLMWIWSDQITEFGGDSSMYVLMARHYSPFYPRSEVIDQMVGGAIYPPLFPFLIGLLDGSLLAAHLLVWAALLGSVWCLYHWLRHERRGQLVSGWTAAVFALMPGTYLLAFNIWSENLYLLFSLIAILCVSRADATANATPRLRWTTALAVAAAGLTRAAALPLLLAFAGHLLLLRPRHWPALLALSCAPTLLWLGWSRLHHSGASGYVDQWMHIYGQHPVAALTAQLRAEYRAIGTSWVQAWLGKNGAESVLKYWILAVGGLCLFGCLQRLLRLKFDAVYAGLYLLQLLLWPFQAEAPRLGYVVIPVLLAQGLLCLSRMRASSARILRPTLLAALSLALLPGLFLALNRFAEQLPPQMEAARHTADYYSLSTRSEAVANAAAYSETLAGLRSLDRLVPEGECIFAVKPPLVALYSGRFSRTPPPAWTSDAEFQRGLGDCSHAYLMALTSPTFPVLMYPMERLGDRAQPLSSASHQEGSTVSVYAILVKIENASAPSSTQ